MNQFRKTRPPQAEAFAIYFSNPSFRALSPALKSRSVALLCLKPRAINSLSTVGVRTIGQLIDQAKRGIVSLHAAGVLTRREIISALDALSKSIRTDDIDWVAYAKRRGFVILPEKQRVHWSPQAFLEELPRVAAAAVGLEGGTKSLVVLRKRLLCPARNVLTLEKIGRQIGTTREFVRQLEDDIAGMLREVFWPDQQPWGGAGSRRQPSDYPRWVCRRSRFQLRPEFLQPLREFAAALTPDDKRRALSPCDWESILKKAWGVRPDQLEAAENLILNLLGLRLAKRTKSMFRGAQKKINRLLAQDYPEGLSPRELATILQKKLGPIAPTMAELPALLRLDPALELFHGRYRSRAGVLSRAADRFERILRRAGKPMHFRKLATSQTLEGGRTTQPAVVSKLYRDPRFVPIGRTGLWAMKAWNLDTRSVTEIAAEFWRKNHWTRKNSSG